MEYGSFEDKIAESTPENKWGYFEKIENEKLKKETEVEKKKDKKEKEAKYKEKKSKEESEPENEKDKKVSSETEEIKDPEREAVKQELAREYVSAKKEELALQIETLQPSSLEYLAAVADLALMEELDLKLENPEAEVEPTVEAAYLQIMEDLEAIVPETVDTEAEPETKATTLIEGNTKETDYEAETASPTEDSTKPTKSTANQATVSRVMSSDTSSGPDSMPKPETAVSKTPDTSSSSEYLKKPERKTENAKRIVAKGAVGAFFIGRSLEAKTTPSVLKRPIESVPGVRTEINPKPEQQIIRAQQKVRQFAVEQATTEQNESLATRLVDSTANFKPKNTNESEAFNLRPISLENVGSKVGESGNIRPNLAPRPKETAVAEPRKPETTNNQAKLEQLKTPDLLKVASNIKIDGKTVRQLFESNKIDYRGLTSIVKEALRGGDIKKAYKKHELGKEAIRGRAIEMRHDNPIDDSSDSSLGVNSDTVGSLIEQLRTVDSQTDTSKLQTNNYAATNEALEISKQKAEAALKKKTLVNISVAAVAAIGIVTALTLFILG